MSHELAIYAAAPEERWRYAQALADASLLPEAYRRQPSNVLLALESGAALNVAPMVAIQEIHVIKGKPSPSAQLMAALVRRAGHRLRITGDAIHARCEIVRADDPEFTFVSEWTMQRAQAAGLTTDMWKKYPANMLKARAISECCRDACPDVVVGFGYTPEELGDPTDTAGAEVTVERGDTQTDTGSATLAETPSETGAAAGSIPAVSSDPVSDDIVDAVLVDETSGAGEASDPTGTPGLTAPAAPAPEPARRDRFDVDQAWVSQEPLWKRLQATLADWQRANGATRADVLLLVSSVLDREVGSTQQLTTSEARRVLDRLKAAA